ncbi:MAG: thiamine pyrophosphate-dependent dehydrogenase E1 component subunit alpha [Actinobacteria bacterium]|nr:thiamine pyrophosphate-dependent dehydrogenase E1 component subunit alpha [Actinomycetota bacterium]
MTPPTPHAEIHRTMVRVRAFELGLRELFREIRRAAAASGKGRLLAYEYGDPDAGPELQGNLELALGQEPTCAAIVDLRPSDYLAGSHRAHHMAVAKGVAMRPMVAELLGRRTGLCRGRSGDFTLHDVSVNFENSPIVGQLLPVATGHALAAKLAGRDEVAVVCVGDGAFNQGVFHESANLAGLWRLPVIFLFENNSYAISTRVEVSSAVLPLAERVAGYGIEAARVPDNDPEGVHAAMTAAVERARSGGGPGFIEVVTDRQAGAFEGDKQLYRPAGELEELEARDALRRYEGSLVARGILSEEDLATVWDEARAEFDDALAYARDGELPDPAEAFENVFAEPRAVSA